MKWGDNDCSARRTLWIAAALLIVSFCHLSCLYEESQARVADQGNRCLRVGRTYNVNGDEVEEGLWWGPDGLRQEVE